MPDVQNTLTFTPDGSLDIGASGATRPRDLWLGRNLSLLGNIGLGIAPPTTSALHISTTLSGTPVWGVRAAPTAAAGTASMQARGLYGRVQTAASATLDEAVAVYAEGPNVGAGATVVTARGLIARNQGAIGVTNAYGVYIEAQSGASTTNIGLYNAGRTRLDNHLDWNTDNTYDIGAAGANRPRDLYLAGALNVAGAVGLPNGAIDTAEIAAGGVSNVQASQLSSLTTSSSTPSAIPGGSISVDMGTTGGTILVYAFGLVRSNGGSARGLMTTRLDGTNDMNMLRADSSPTYIFQGGCWRYAGVSSGTHTVTVVFAAFDSASCTFDSGFLMAVGLKR